MAKLKILICDDDDGILDMLSMVLRSMGYEPVVEMHSNNIYDKIDEVKPDLLLLDLWMPKLSGEEILKTLKNQKTTKKLPIIVMSASRDGASIAKQFQADDFLDKPFDIKKLVTKIEQHAHN